MKKSTTVPVLQEMTAAKLGERLILEGTDRASSLFDLAAAVRAGLTTDPKMLPPWIFYDEAGSRLFVEIMDLPEYYLTRAERQILRENAARIAALFGDPVDMVELGSGNASKTRLLIEALLERHGTLRYMPIDISRPAVLETSHALLMDYTALGIHAFACEFSAGLERITGFGDRAKLVLWLGSTIGNSERADAVALMKQVRAALRKEDRFLVGIDMRKDPWILRRAYNDSRGVTARFNKNVLARINRELGADFDPDAFDHRAIYDEPAGAIRLYLVSRMKQTVRIPDLDLTVQFERGEPLHTENSYKYSPAEIKSLALASGLAIERQWSDPLHWFTLNLLAPLR